MRFFLWRVPAAHARSKQPRKPEGAQLLRHTIAVAARNQPQVMSPAKPNKHLPRSRN
jgi:hypothetical protein